jgi:lipid II:glycine glycyltransferase (peptidoglycan interpeptide bridge formation enzyme)
LHPQGTLWQSLAWKRYHEACGREVRVYAAESDERRAMSGELSASALVIIDRTAGGFSTWEIPRGPLWTSEEGMQALLQRIAHDAKSERCISLYLSPSIVLTAHSSQLTASHRHVQPTATRIIDLTVPEEQILAQMHSKGRYNINLARKHGVAVVQGSANDIPGFYGLLQETGKRDGFTIASESHYTRFLSSLEGSFLLMAKHEDRPIAGLLGVIWNGIGIYYYGASSFADRALMAPYLLQWEAMRQCRMHGCGAYDLLGIEDESRINNQESRGSWAGITEFKRKFGGTVVTYPQEQVQVLRPWMNRALWMKRKVLG